MGSAVCVTEHQFLTTQTMNCRKNFYPSHYLSSQSVFLLYNYTTTYSSIRPPLEELRALSGWDRSESESAGRAMERALRGLWWLMVIGESGVDRSYHQQVRFSSWQVSANSNRNPTDLRQRLVRREARLNDKPTSLLSKENHHPSNSPADRPTDRHCVITIKD